MAQMILQSWFQRSQGLRIFQRFIHLILLNYFFSEVSAQTEISRSFFSPFSTDDNWKAYLAQNSNHITNCVTSDIYGGRLVFNSQTVITKTYILPPHYKIQFEFKFWRLDPWSSAYYILFINGQQEYSSNPFNNTGEQICGSGTLGQIDQVSKQVAHTGNSAIIFIVSRQNSAYWGISDFILSVLKCPHFCDSDGVCLKWYRVLAYFKTLILVDGQGWEKDNALFNNVLDCGFQYYGNFQTSQVASINLNLNDPHTQLKLSFIFLTLEITGSVTIEVIGDTQLYYFAPPLTFITTDDYLCGSYLKMTKVEIYGFPCTSTSMTISIGTPIFTTVSGNTPKFGIRDFEVFSYQENKIIIDESLLHLDDYILGIEGIFSQQYNCVVGCSNCIRELCVECFSGWNFDTNSQECIPICGDQLILYLEVCDDGNMEPNDGCYQCKFSCPLNCTLCEYGQCIYCDNNYQLIDSQCHFSLQFEDENSLIQYDIQINEGQYSQISNFLTNAYLQHVTLNNNFKLEAHEPENCFISVFNECQICTNQFEKSFNGQCLPICNYGIYLVDEFLDNSLQIQLDGTSQCSRCQLECLECHNSYCFQCLNGWNLVNFKCEQECGDGKIALGSSEQCDDQNEDIGDGCYQCKFECQYNCVFCSGHLQCAICQEYFEIKDQNCIPICGDGNVVEGLEICDDGNDIPYDGCHNCQYSCRENCQICDHQNCLDKCDQGYYYLDNKCNSICGDSIVAVNEQCDDGNDDPFDGCDSCLLSCPQNCNYCKEGLCSDCDIGFNMINNNCQDTCGNGFKSDIEQCDDGNHLNLDGCSDTCVIEIYWTCFEEDFKRSSCMLNKPPHFNLIFLNQTYNVQYVQLQFTNQIKLLDSSQNLTQNFKASLVDIDPSYYIISKTLVKEPDSFGVHEIIYQLRIEVLEQLQSDILLQVQLNTLLVDQNDFQVDNDICTINLKNPIVLTDAQKQISHKISSYNSTILIFLGISSMIILISGNPAECFEILDTIQYQSNLKFININFPQNLMIYFESSDVVTIIPILVKVGIFGLFQNVIGSQQLEAFGKFQSYNINCDLISNLYGFFTQLLLGTILLILSYCYLKYIFRAWFIRIRVLIYANTSILVSYQFAFFIHMFNKFSLGLLKILSQQGIVYIIQMNCWDLTFKALLYLFTEKENNLRNIGQTIIAVFILIAVVCLMFLFFSCSLSKLKPNNFTNFSHEGLLISKKFLILLMLIGCQRNPIVQCVIIALINTLYITLILTCKMVNNKIDLIVILIFEIPIILVTLLNLSFDSNIVKFISSEVQVWIGFVQIGLMSIGITAPLTKYVSEIKKMEVRKNQKTRKTESNYKFIYLNEIYSIHNTTNFKTLISYFIFHIFNIN
ncbi:unnamed protein product [Paramecium octaurelia]|uniref:Uncharacterized protein n=1 Tax=Paramecium octaurelia TaxID=43137 RepID=A0A8S1Y1P8_PAROT|nr:unnamed protein product [Paramecium octaurelia]